MEISQPWLETIIKRHEAQTAICKISEVTEEDVVGKGDNYASDLIRLKMKVILGSGNTAARSVILKRVPSTELRAKAILEWGIFRNEIQVYSTIIPPMENLLDELEGQEKVWGRCIHYKPYNQIIMEDLKELGYKMGDRRIGLDFEHVRLAVKSLARYHALSVILKNRGLLDPNYFSKSAYISKEIEMFQSYMDLSFHHLAEAIEHFWGPEWQTYKGKIQQFIGKQSEQIKEICEAVENKYLVLNHGDCWTNNMMFKYSTNGAPMSLKFIDFQAPFYSSCGYDLAYFLATSPQADVFEGRLDEILSEYQESLKRTFELFPHDTPTVPSQQDVKKEVERFAFFALTVAIVVLPIMMAAPGDIPELEEWFKEAEEENNLQFNVDVYRNKEFVSKIKLLLKWCSNNHVFGK